MILKKDPSNLRAQILSANCYAGIVHFNESIEEIRRVFEIQPRLLPAYFDLSSTPLFQRKAVLAEQIYKEALKANPISVEAHLALADSYLQSGKVKEAEEEFKATTLLDPKSLDASQALAFFYMQTQHLDAAEKVYSQLVESHPEDLSRRVILAEFYSGTGKLDKAAEILEELVAKNPQYLPAKRNLADISLRKGDLARAAQLVDETLKAAPKDLEAQLLKGRISLAQRKTSEAVTELQKLVKAQPASPLGRYFLGLAYSQAQDPQRAGQEFLAAIQNDAAFVQAYTPLAQLKLDSGEVDGAIQYARQALSFNANLVDPHLVLSRAYTRVKNYRAATDEVALVLRADPRNWLGLYHQGLVDLAQDKFADAETHFEAAQRQAPADQADSLNALANLLFRQKRPEKAIQRINQAIEASPNNSAYYRTLAYAHLAQDDKAKAEEAFQKAVSVNPTDLDMRLAQAQFCNHRKFGEGRRGPASGPERQSRKRFGKSPTRRHVPQPKPVRQGAPGSG